MMRRPGLRRALALNHHSGCALLVQREKSVFRLSVAAMPGHIRGNDQCARHLLDERALGRWVA